MGDTVPRAAGDPAAARGESPAGHVGLRPSLRLKGWLSAVPRLLPSPTEPGRSRARVRREFSPRRWTGRAPLPTRGTAWPPLPARPADSPAPPAASPSSRPAFLKEVTACHPLVPRAAPAGRRRSPAAPGQGVPRLSEGVSPRWQQGEFPGILLPPPALEGSGWQEEEGRRGERWERARDPSAPSLQAQERSPPRRKTFSGEGDC